MSNNEKMGGASPHNEYVACALVRSSGEKKATGFMANRTRTNHPHTDKHYQYESAGEGWGGNVLR